MALSMRERVRNLHTPNRREFLIGAGAVAASALALDMTAYERHHVVVEERTVRIRRLPPAFHGMRIIQLSDIHFRDYDEDEYLRHVVAKANALKPDMIALTGDYITAIDTLNTNWPTALPVCAEILSGLEAPIRVCTLGNHDAIDANLVARTLRDRKLTVLHNDLMAVDVRGDRLWLGGIADASLDKPDPDKAIPKDGGASPVILLGHEPDYADAVAAHGGVDLMLAGHSHGGQVRIPGVTPLFLPRLGRRYVQGLFHLGEMQLYVNRGIGAIHLPIRFRCPPEITLFTLQPAE